MHARTLPTNNPTIVASLLTAAGTCVALFGHAVFLNAIAFKVAQAAGASEDMKNVLLDMDLGEVSSHLDID